MSPFRAVSSIVAGVGISAGGRILAAGLLAAIFQLVGADTASAGDQPPVILGSRAVTVDQGSPVTIYSTALTEVRFQLLDLGGQAKAECLSGSTAAGLCSASGGLVRIQIVATPTTGGSGTLVVIDQTTRLSDSVSVVVPGPPQPSEPTALTFGATGCEGWYDTWIFDCPSRAITIDSIPSYYVIPSGVAELSGGGGGGTLTVSSSGGSTSDPETARIALDGFGESTGTLGSGSSAVDVTIRRRAPLLFGWITVLLGAALAAIFGWFSNWAQAKSAADLAEEDYAAAHRDLENQRAAVMQKMEQLKVGQWASVWGAGPDDPQPAPLSSSDQHDQTAVDHYKAAAGTSKGNWQDLASLLTTKATIATVRSDTPLEAWVTELISSGPAAPTFTSDLGVANAAAQCVADWNQSHDGRLEPLLQAHQPDEVSQAVNATQAPQAIEAPAAAVPAPAMPRLGPTDAGRGRSIPVRIRAARLASWKAGAAVLAVLIVGLFVAIGTLTRPTTAVAAALLFMVAPVGLGLAVWRAVATKKLPVLIAALLGAVLAAAFGGGDALDATKGWGSAADVVTTIGASFSVAGAVQVLRVGAQKLTLGS